MDDNRPPHPADEFLESPLPQPANLLFRDNLRNRTTKLVRRQRWVRRARLVVAMAACYLAGVLTMRYTMPTQHIPPPEVVHQPPPPAVPEVPAPAPIAVAAVPESTLDLEWRAFEATEERAELYRLAGDRYLQQEDDLQSALRCYRQALNASPDEKLAISAGDTWLLMALKESRQKEKTHVRNDG